MVLRGREGFIMPTVLGQVAHVSVGRCVVSAHSSCSWHPEVRLRVLDEGGLSGHITWVTCGTTREMEWQTTQGWPSDTGLLNPGAYRSHIFMWRNLVPERFRKSLIFSCLKSVTPESEVILCLNGQAWGQTAVGGHSSPVENSLVIPRLPC